MTTRLQIPAYTDRWMMGDRFGELLRVSKHKQGDFKYEVAHVRLDKSGKVVRVLLQDCTVL